jgi:DNA-binding ferritin-like protein
MTKILETETTGHSVDTISEISDALRHLLADVFVLYLKTKNFIGT